MFNKKCEAYISVLEEPASCQFEGVQIEIAEMLSEGGASEKAIGNVLKVYAKPGHKK